MGNLIKFRMGDGHKEMDGFTPLWPKLMKKMGKENCVGEKEASVSTFDIFPTGPMGMENLSAQAIMENAD